MEQTRYLNTDFDLKSKSPFDALHAELDAGCCVLHYTEGEDGFWYSIVESNLCGTGRTAEMDILHILEVVKTLTPPAKDELQACIQREFNMGFDCGDTWGYVHALPPAVVRAVADAQCSLAVTLYPMRNPDGSLRK